MEKLNIVRGLVRPFIVFVLMALLSYLAVFKNLDPEKILSSVLVVIGFYFGERSTKRLK